jgi:hypothetical protein
MTRTVTGTIHDFDGDPWPAVGRQRIGWWQHMMDLWSQLMATDRRVTKAGDPVNA